ncbi:MAG TPA: hypothetical protein VFS39_07345 [Nitrospira sp.]|nr:hypothetical protein [Nitrospira sp.]
MSAAVDFVFGVLAGGLAISMCWGLFWLVVVSLGVARRTCSWRPLANSLAVTLTPILFIWGLLKVRGEVQPGGGALFAGLAIMPIVLTWLAVRRRPDGRMAGTQMLDGVRQLVERLLGKHRECGGCGDEHGQDHGGCR